MLAAAALLGACGADEGADNGANVAAPVLRKGPMLGSVDLSQPVRAGGASPYWAIEIAPGSITYADRAEADAKRTDFYPVSPRVDADRAVFPTQTPEGAPVTITLTRAACGEGEPLRAEVKIGGRVLTGCAGPAGGSEAAPGNAGAAK